LGDLPLEQGESVDSAIDLTYIYGVIDFGDGFTRFVFARPVMPSTESDVNSSTSLTSNEFSEEKSIDNSEKTIAKDNFQENFMPVEIPVDFRTCILTGLGNKKLFKEILSYKTFIFEIHHENLYERAFHARNIDSYNNFFNSSQESAASAAAPVNTAKGGKGGNSASLPPPDAITAKVGPLDEKERFLLECIRRALKGIDLINIVQYYFI
jgi:hypothetical protein